jgi:hypothetical protein
VRAGRAEGALATASSRRRRWTWRLRRRCSARASSRPALSRPSTGILSSVRKQARRWLALPVIIKRGRSSCYSVPEKRAQRTVALNEEGRAPHRRVSLDRLAPHLGRLLWVEKGKSGTRNRVRKVSNEFVPRSPGRLLAFVRTCERGRLALVSAIPQEAYRRHVSIQSIARRRPHRFRRRS